MCFSCTKWRIIAHVWTRAVNSLLWLEIAGITNSFLCSFWSYNLQLQNNNNGESKKNMLKTRNQATGYRSQQRYSPASTFFGFSRARAPLQFLGTGKLEREIRWSLQTTTKCSRRRSSPVPVKYINKRTRIPNKGVGASIAIP